MQSWSITNKPKAGLHHNLHYCRVLSNLTNLRGLGLVDNQLSSLPEDIFEYLINLEALGIANTQLSSLPDGLFKNLTNLRSCLKTMFILSESFE